MAFGIHDPQVWVEQIVQRNPEAENDFARYFGQRLYAMCMARIHHSEDSRDLVQEILLACLTSIREGRLRDSEKLPNFVAGTGRNLISNFLRARLRNPGGESLTDNLPDVMFEIEAEDQQRVEAFERAVSFLSESDHRILSMSLIEGYKPAEIAAKLGISSEVVRTRKLRALRKLADVLQQTSHKPAARPQVKG